MGSQWTDRRQLCTGQGPSKTGFGGTGAVQVLEHITKRHLHSSFGVGAERHLGSRVTVELRTVSPKMDEPNPAQLSPPPPPPEVACSGLCCPDSGPSPRPRHSSWSLAPGHSARRLLWVPQWAELLGTSGHAPSRRKLPGFPEQFVSAATGLELRVVAYTGIPTGAGSTWPAPDAVPRALGTPGRVPSPRK